MFAMTRSLRLLVAFIVVAALAITLGFAVFSSTVEANHRWEMYHWERSGSLEEIEEIELNNGDNLVGSWDKRFDYDDANDMYDMENTDYLDRALSDWSKSTRVNMTKVPGGTNEPNGPRTRKKCSPTAGQIEVCNERYGNNGWVGLTSIWTSGVHISQATSKLNDTYFDRASYNNPQWRLGTLCHELGHTVGLGHPSTDFNVDKETCMDYYSKPDGNNMVPNAHDYEVLIEIYDGHPEPPSTSSRTESRGAAGALSPALSNIDTTQPSERGKLIKKDKKEEVYERNLGSGRKLYTFVTLAKEEDQLPQQRQQQEQQDQPQQQQDQPQQQHDHEDH